MIKKFSIVIFMIFIMTSIKSQENVFSSDLSGITIIPILSSTADSPEKLYYIDIVYERSIDIDKSILFDFEYGRFGVHELFINTRPTEKILANSFNISFEMRNYYSKKKYSPLGFYTGAFYKHYFLRDKYYNYDNDTYVYQGNRVLNI